MEMRIETGDAVDLIQRHLRAFRQAFEFRLGQKAVPQLYRSQVVKNHGTRSHVAVFCKFARLTGARTAQKGELNPLHTTCQAARL